MKNIMKRLQDIKHPKITIVMLIVGIVYFSWSCSKMGSEINNPLEKLSLNVRVVGIDETVRQGNSGSQARLGFESQTLAPTQEFAGFDATVEVDHKLQPKGRRAILKSGSKNSKGKSLYGALMDPGVKYRLFLYKADNTFVSSTVLTSDIAATIGVEAGVSYKWYALSYNSSETPMDIDPLNPSVTTLNMPEGKDILYDAGTFNVPTGPTPINVAINILFNHKVSRIGVELNSMGMFANMTAGTVSISGLTLNTGTFDLSDGTWKSYTPYTATLDWSKFGNVEPAYSDRKIAYFFTAKEDLISGIGVQLSGLDLAIDDNSTRSFNTLLAATPSVFNFNVTPQVANDHRLLINLIESPLTIGGKKWARTNLYYVAGHNAYRFHHTYAHTAARNTFFSFKGVVPENFGINGDPCALVYPAGKWIQPSDADFQNVITIGDTYTTYGTVGVLGYFEYTNSTGTAAPYPGKNLRFNFNGGSTDVTVLGGVVNVTLGNYGDIAEIWTSSSGLILPLDVALSAWHYNGRMNITFKEDVVAAQLLNVKAIGVDVVESPFKNIRCIRAPGQ